MSKPTEHKRVSLTTVSSSNSTVFGNGNGNGNGNGTSGTSTIIAAAATGNESNFGAGPAFSRFGADFLAPDAPAAGKTNANKSANKAIRLTLELFETDSNKYPEFNYSKLLQLEKKKAKKLKTKISNGPTSDPFADNDDDVERIAKAMEEKYGNAYASGRGRSKKDDLCDIGMGYDETDSFIDNTEAYDEVVPEEVETIEGGFYINCGALEFKSLTKKSGTTRTDAIIKMPERARKRVLSTSSEESSSSNENDDEDNDDDDDDEDEEDEENNSDSESLDDEATSESAKAKKKYKNSQKNLKIANVEKQTASNPNGSNKKPAKKLTITSSSSNSPRPSAQEASDTDERQAQALKKVVKTTTVKDMLKAKRDSFLKLQGDAAVKGGINGEVKCTSTDIESSSENGGTDSATEQRSDKQGKNKECSENLRTADTILPSTLDVEILSSVNSFKDMVRSRDMCGKKFFFDDKSTALLLKVYEALLCTDRNERNMVFAHLEYQLQLPKYFILRKSKALRSKEEKSKTTVSLENLRKAVADVMPKAIANYETELRKFAELQAADVNAEHPPKMPRKKFQWSNELRVLLYEVYQARWTSYAVLGKRKDSLVDFINGYLRDKVVELWPTGWMRYEELQREIEKHKNASKKAKEKTKKVPTPAPAEIQSTANSYLKQFEEFAGAAQNRNSLASSESDAVSSGTSNNLKRKLKDLTATNETNTKSIGKLPKKKAQKLQQQQQSAVLPPATLESILSLASSSAQSAVMNLGVNPMDLLTAAKKTDHSIYSIMTAASLAAASVTNTTITSSTLHSKTAGTQVVPHVINLDEYKSPRDILQTSKQLAAANSSNSRMDKPKWPVRNSPPTVARQESGSDTDSVEFVGVFPMNKAAAYAGTGGGGGAKPKSNHKTKTASTATVTSSARSQPSNGPNGAHGYKMDNIYMYNNNTSKPNAAAAVRAGMPPVAIDLSGNQIMKSLSDLKAFEKHMKLAQYPLSSGNIKGGAAGAPSHQ